MKTEPSVICPYSIKHLAKNFKAIRFAFGCSLDEIAANLGCTRQTVAKYERPDYKWKPLDYFALKGMFELLACSTCYTDYYYEIWYRLVEGMSYGSGDCTTEEESERLANRILLCASECPRNIGYNKLSDIIHETLVREECLYDDFDDIPDGIEGETPPTEEELISFYSMERLS